MNFEELRGTVYSVAETVVRIIKEADPETDIDEYSIRLAMATFAMYLSSSDGEIKWEEAQAIDDCFGIGLASPEQLKNFIVNANIYSTEFESDPPVALTLLIASDNMLFRKGEDPEKWGHEIVIDCYKAIADAIINADNDVDDNEVSDSNIYITMMENYAKEHLSGYAKKG